MSRGSVTEVVEWSLSRARPPKRGRIAVRYGEEVAQNVRKLLREELLDLASQSAANLERDVRAAYESVTDLGISPPRFTVNALFLGLIIRDKHFFYQEWDTKPHWPPFGKGSKLQNWALAHGMPAKAAFFIARKMAPEKPTGRVFTYELTSSKGKVYQHSHKMTVGGLGGYESKTRPGVRVATSGKLAATRALGREAELLASRAAEVLADLLGPALEE